MHIIGRAEFPCKSIERIIQRRSSKPRKITRDRPVSDSGYSQAHPLDVDDGGTGGDREIAMAGANLGEGVAYAGLWLRERNCLDQLVIRPAGDHCSNKEFIRWNDPPLAPGSQPHLALECEQA